MLGIWGVREGLRKFEILDFGKDFSDFEVE
jgi:hypothetical protein